MEFDYEKIHSVLSIPPLQRKQKDIENLVELTKNVYFFNKLTADHDSQEIHHQCSQQMVLETHAKNEIIFNFGEKGEKFYVILKGSVSVKIPSKKKITLHKENFNKFLYENDTFYDTSESSQLFEQKSTEEGLILKIADVLNNLIPTGNIENNEENEMDQILNLEGKNLVKIFKKSLKKEKKVLLSVLKSIGKKHIEVEIDEFIEVNRLHRGDSFGELALISDSPRAATIQVLEDCSLLVLNKSDFKKILGSIAEKKIYEVIHFMVKLPCFSDWTKISLIKLSYFLELKTFTRHQYLFIEGDVTDGIYFIKSGECTLSKKKILENKSVPKAFNTASQLFTRQFLKKSIKTVDVKIIIKSKYESVGSIEVLENLEARKFSCQCTSTKSEVYYMSKQVFFTRIQDLDLFKGFFQNEKERLTKRFRDLTETSPENIEVRSSTPTLQKKTLKNSEFPEILRNSTSKKLILYNLNKKLSKENTFQRKSPEFQRKITPKEIEIAVNGRPRISPPRKLSPFRCFSPLKLLKFV